LNAPALWQLFSDEYLAPREPLRYVSHESHEHGGRVEMQLTVDANGRRMQLHGSGNGPLDAAVHALGLPVRIDGYEERALQGGSDAQAVAFVELAWPGAAGSAFGVGVHTSILSASILAVVSGINRWHTREPQAVQAAFERWARRPAVA
jgi:2-isopropylmalate synthase